MINGKKLVALCASRVYDPQIHGFIVKLNERLRAENFALLVYAINSDIYWEEDRQAAEKYIFNLIPYHLIDAVVIMDEKIKSHRIAEQVIGEAKKNDLPVVIADGTYENVSCINYDYEPGFEKVVRHVIEDHKVRRPHMMAGQPDNDFSNRRIEVFKKVLEENDILFDDSMLSYGYFWADPCRIATKQLLEREEIPEAIICANDLMAITVSELFSEAGYRIPEDVIITGFDGYDEIYFTSPKITTASCDILLMADAVADSLIESVQDGGIHNKKIQPVLVPNESCGCPEHNEHPRMLQDWFKESFARHNDDNRVLQQITSSMQTSSSPGELVSYLESYKMECLLAAVDRKCFDEECNYFTNTEDFNSAKEYILIYDSDYPEKYKPGVFDITKQSDELIESLKNSSRDEKGFCKDVCSTLLSERILQLTESGYPLIFNSLDFMNRCFGFLCFFFRDYFISNYSNTMSVTNCVSIGIGGYINIQYQRQLLDKMDEMYRHDPLTGLYNRTGFMNAFKKMKNMPEYKNKSVTIIMSDLDGLKYINDHFGHAEGDSSIVAVANALFNAVPETSLSTRFGGDEVFSIIFEDTDPEEIINKMDLYLDSYNEKSGKPYKVSTSSGYVVTVLSDNFDIAHEIKSADEDMYRNKGEKYSSRGQVGNLIERSLA